MLDWELVNKTKNHWHFIGTTRGRKMKHYTPEDVEALVEKMFPNYELRCETAYDIDYPHIADLINAAVKEAVEAEREFMFEWCDDYEYGLPQNITWDQGFERALKMMQRVIRARGVKE